MKSIFASLLLSFSLLACQSKGQEVSHSTTAQLAVIDEDGLTIKTRFPTPEGFSRKPVSEDSFGYYLRTFKLKPDGTSVYHYDGSKKRNEVHAAVLNIDTGNRDLQQCADAIMRLRGEYLYSTKNYGPLHFNFTNGFKCSFEKWRQGFRPKINGNKVNWVKSTSPNDDYTTFRKYMNMVFSYAGTHSLEKELKSTSLNELEIGQVFIQGGFPGHAVLVVDVAENDAGEKAFLIAQSYMPAQDIHVLKNPNSTSAWYLTSEIEKEITTPEWTFTSNDLKSFN